MIARRWCIVAVLLILAGCGGGDNTDDAADGRVTIDPPNCAASAASGACQ